MTRIGKCAFLFCSKLTKIEIPINSALTEIDEYAFSRSSITSISIPSTILRLNTGWCIHTEQLNEIKIIQREEQNIKYLDENKFIIIGKSDMNFDVFDVLVDEKEEEQNIKYLQSPPSFGSPPCL